jgi:hypothetical protein
MKLAISLVGSLGDQLFETRVAIESLSILQLRVLGSQTGRNFEMLFSLFLPPSLSPSLPLSLPPSLSPSLPHSLPPFFIYFILF